MTILVFSYVEFKWTNFVITKSLMFIDTNYSIEEQKHAIIEELDSEYWFIKRF